MKTNISYTRIIMAVLFIMTANSIFAQRASKDEDSTRSFSHAFIGRFQGDSIELRWAPTSFVIWQHAAEEGWKLERIELSKSFYNLNDQSPLTGDTVFKAVPGGLIKPWTQEEMTLKAAKTDSNTGAALQLLYGPSVIPAASDPFGAMKKLEEDQARRFGFAMIAADFSSVTANALGLRFVDRNLKAGKAYLYRIYVPVYNSDLLMDTIQVIVDTRAPWEPTKVQKVFTESGDKEISINWPPLNDQFFSAYDIERSSDKKNWTVLNYKPYMVSKSFADESAGFYVDTTLEANYKTYHYRVRGYSAFGDKGLYSDIVSASSRDLKAPAPALDIKVIDLGMNKVKITWAAFATEKDFKGFYVGKSVEAAGTFPKISKLLNPSVREYIDDNINPLVSNYYVVITTDTSGNESVSYVAYADLMDTIAPAKPIGLTAEVDTFGYVYLNWKEGEEKDIIGYRVYWANDPNAEFSQITGDFVPGINYTDSIELNTLTEKVYYRVAAVDHRYNHSEMSDILTLNRPDKVAPVSPVILNYQTGDNQVSFQWINSTSTDVVKQILRRREGIGEWKILSEIANNKVDQYSDKTVEKKKDYTYEIIAVDDAGNFSEPSFPLELTIIDNGQREGVSGLRITKDDKNKSVQLNWILPAGKIAKVLVYKNNAEEGLIYYRTLTAKENAFKDNYSTPGASWAIKLVYSDGMDSAMSEEVK